jgi:arylsulfatase A-like enzyme
MKTAVAIAILLLCSARADGAAADKTQPNIVFLVADDMGYGDVGFQGCRDIPTPHLDALAASGVRFTNGYVSGPYCSPSRAGLMTGRYQQRFGHEFNPGAGHGLPIRESTIADRLSAAGYATGLVGKWHLGDLPEMHPQRRGFDEFFGFLGGGHDYFKTSDILRGTARSEETEYLTDALGREAVAFIERHRGEPFFLYLSFNAVHTPRQADEVRLAKFASITDLRRRIYAAMLSALDDAVGRVRARLAETGLEKNTLVCFISDNGGPVMPGTGTTVNGSDNTPLRGSKRTTLEGGIRVPFVVSWPARLKPGSYHRSVIQLDVHATALAAAGIAAQPDWQLDGVDLLPFLSGHNRGAPHDALYWRLGEQTAIRLGDYKLVRSEVPLPGGGAQLDSAARLYRLSDDIREAVDLAKAMPDKVQELQRRWNAWNATLIAPLWADQQ